MPSSNSRRPIDELIRQLEVKAKHNEMRTQGSNEASQELIGLSEFVELTQASTAGFAYQQSMVDAIRALNENADIRITDYKNTGDAILKNIKKIYDEDPALAPKDKRKLDQVQDQLRKIIEKRSSLKSQLKETTNNYLRQKRQDVGNAFQNAQNPLLRGVGSLLLRPDRQKDSQQLSSGVASNASGSMGSASESAQRVNSASMLDTTNEILNKHTNILESINDTLGAQHKTDQEQYRLENEQAERLTENQDELAPKTDTLSISPTVGENSGKSKNPFSMLAGLFRNLSSRMGSWVLRGVTQAISRYLLPMMSRWAVSALGLISGPVLAAAGGMTAGLAYALGALKLIGGKPMAVNKTFKDAKEIFTPEEIGNKGANELSVQASIYHSIKEENPDFTADEIKKIALHPDMRTVTLNKDGGVESAVANDDKIREAVLKTKREKQTKEAQERQRKIEQDRQRNDNIVARDRRLAEEKAAQEAAATPEQLAENEQILRDALTPPAATPAVAAAPPSVSTGTSVPPATTSASPERVKPPTTSPSTSSNSPIKNTSTNKLENVRQALAQQGITDPAYVAAILGNVMKETGGVPKSENLLGYKNTSNKRIREIFKSRSEGKTDAELNAIKNDEKKWAEFVYGDKLGNTEQGDGYKYRGRGYIQLTGKSNYSAASKALFGDDRLVKNPDLVNDPDIAAATTAWYMKQNQKSMSKKMGIDLNNMTQDEANVLATSQVAGRDVRNAGDFLKNQTMQKVSTYAAMFNAPSAERSVGNMGRTSGALASPTTASMVLAPTINMASNNSRDAAPPTVIPVPVMTRTDNLTPYYAVNSF